MVAVPSTTCRLDVKRTGWAMVHCAARNDQVEVLDELLEQHGALEVNRPTHIGAGPLHVAAFHDKVVSLRVLLHHSAINLHSVDHVCS